MFMQFERLARNPRPGDPQIHKSSLKDHLPAMLMEATVEGKKYYPDKIFNGYTYQIVPDGDNNHHYNLCVYLMDETPKDILDPRNLNGAPQMAFGQLVPDEELTKYNVGFKETRF